MPDTSDTAQGDGVELAQPIPMNIAQKANYSEEFLLSLKQSPLVHEIPMLYKIEISSTSPQLQRFGGQGAASTGGNRRGGFRKYEENDRNYQHQNHNGRRNNHHTEEDADSQTVEWDMPSAPGTTAPGGGGGFFGLDDDQNPPAWLDASAESQKLGRGNVGHTVKEFEEWKQRKKIEELRNAGFEVPDPEPVAIIEEEDFFNTDTGSTAAHAPANGSEPKPRNVDSLFGLWDSTGQEGNSSVATPIPPHANRTDNPSSDPDHGSRFSRFFTPPQATAQVAAQQYQQQPPPSSIPHGAAPVPGQDDKEGFQRIMSMLGNSSSQVPQSPQVPQVPQVSQAPQAPQAPHAVQPNQPMQAPPQDNDLFFQSLLNKSRPEQSPQQQHQPQQHQPQQHQPQRQQHQPQRQQNQQQQRRPQQQPHTAVSPPNGITSMHPGSPPNISNIPPGFPPPPPGFPFPPPPPGMFLDKNGQPLPPEMLPFPPPPPGMVFDKDGKPISYNGQPLPPLPMGVPPPFFGGPSMPQNRE